LISLIFLFNKHYSKSVEFDEQILKIFFTFSWNIDKIITVGFSLKNRIQNILWLFLVHERYFLPKASPGW